MTVAGGRRRRSPLRPLARFLLLLALGAVLFVLGVALGRATREQPDSGRRVEVRTLRPATVGPPARTVTVTVTGEG